VCGGGCAHLSHSAGEAIEDESLAAIGFLDFVADDANNDVISHERTCCHQIFGLLANLSASGDGSPQHVTSGELRGTASLDNVGGVGALA